MVQDLRKCAELAEQKENEGVELLFCSLLEAEWRELHPRSRLNQHQLLRKYDDLKGKGIEAVEEAEETDGQDGDNAMVEKGNCQEVDTVWTPELVENLRKCKEHALKIQDAMRKRNVEISYMKTMHKEWLKLYPNSTQSANSLATQLWVHQKQQQTGQNKKDEHCVAYKETKRSKKTECTPQMLQDLEKCYNDANKITAEMK